MTALSASVDAHQKQESHIKNCTWGMPYCNTA
jgi:hypothetical protein